MTRPSIDHDIHIHTYLSSCSDDPETVPSKIISKAQEEGLAVVGFADHMWDSSIPGASEWYQTQDLDHVLQIREQLPEDTQGVEVLIGCESEYCGDGLAGISKKAAEQLDFVLLPMSHFHMTGFVVQKWQVSTHKKVADLLVRRFQEVIELGLATGIAHPFLPLGFKDHIDTIIGQISDTAFEDCFGRAAARSVSIEIQPAFFPELMGAGHNSHHSETYLRMFSIAKDMGCCFHVGSDAHTLAGIGRTRLLMPYLEQLGIENEDLISFSGRGITIA